MERSVGRSDHPVPDSWAEPPREASGGRTAAGEEPRVAGLVFLLAGEIVAFAALAASGNMPGIVTMLYRALLTL